MILENGTRIYSRGDRANRPYFATIINVHDGEFYLIKLDNGLFKNLPTCCISKTYENNGDTRVVTEKSYNEWREKALLELKKAMKRLDKQF